MNPDIQEYRPQLHQQHVLSIFKSRPDIFPESEVRQIIKDLSLPGTETHFKVVAVIDKKVVGYCGAYQDNASDWYLDWFSVDPFFKRQGIGKMLLFNILSWLEQKRISLFRVETCSCEGEAVARKFYENQGFVLEKIEKDGYASGHSKLTYSKVLV